MVDVIVIGGGASGMAAAISAARNGNKVILFEKNNKLGRKVAASGNGKCNLTNANIASSFYHDAYKADLDLILKQCDLDTVLEFMKSVGIRCKEKRGYYYPLSEQAAVVVQMLQAELEHLQVKLYFEERVTDVVQRKNGTFGVMTEKAEYCAKRVILASGGLAAPKLGADGIGYQILKDFGHTVIEPVPALVQMLVQERYVKKISGVRTEAKICLSVGNQRFCEEGEIIFTDNGVSGIPVFQLSRYVTNAVKEKCNICLSINVIPTRDKNSILSDVSAMIQYNPELPLEYLFRTYCNHKLVYALICEAGLDAQMPCRKLANTQITKLIHNFQNMVLHITGTNGFEQAQVTRGGIPLNEVEPSTMESKIIPGLHITGELLDIDGICGGYNLHFAWATGILAGNRKA